MSADVQALPADPFGVPSQIMPPASRGMADVPFGQVGGNGRYKMPLLPGEQGTKSCPAGVQPWVPGGLMRATNLAAAISDSEALNIWEQEQALIGLALDSSLYEELCLTVQRAVREGVNLQRLDLHPELRLALTGTWKDRDASLAGRAKATAGADRARRAGTNRHEAWEYWGQTGELIGPPGIQAQMLALDALLTADGLERVPGLSERVVRNTAVGCAGKFDDILRVFKDGSRWGPVGRLLMADLKNKSRKFWTWLEVDIQLSIYANAEWMLAPSPRDVTHTVISVTEQAKQWATGGRFYEPGPFGNVDPDVGVVLVAPSDGAAPYLRKADLKRGWANAQLARRVVDERAYAKSAERHTWGGES